MDLKQIHLNYADTAEVFGGSSAVEKQANGLQRITQRADIPKKASSQVARKSQQHEMTLVPTPTAGNYILLGARVLKE